MGLVYRFGLFIILLFTALNIYGRDLPVDFVLSDTISNVPDSVVNRPVSEVVADTIAANDSIAALPGLIVKTERVTALPDSIAKKIVPVKDTVKYWKTGGCLTLNVSQIALSNWSSGGENSIAANALLNLTANYSKKNAVWDNTLDFYFGRLKRENTKAVKTDDRLEFSTKYGRRIAKKWFYSALLNFRTQVFPGYDYPEKDSIKISDFLSPATVFLSIGIDYKPSNNFTFLLSSITGKTTIVKSDKIASYESFGVDSGKHFRHEFGGYMKLIKKGTFFKVVNYQFKIDAFSNYMEKPENIDWDCELMVWAKLNKFITANFKANLLYDDDVVTAPNAGPRIQFREYVGIGLSYRF